MRAFKKLMAGMIATAIAATLATSAFAAELNANNKMVLSAGESYTPATTGQTTVLVVPYDAWVSGALTDLDDADILYIDQYANAAAATAAITEGLGVKLNNGELADINTTEGAADYYVLFGGNTNDGAFAITALECVIGEEADGPVLKFADVNQDGEISAQDVTRLLRHTSKVEILNFSEEDLKAVCDINKDGEVSAQDVTRLLRHTSKVEIIEGLE